MYSRYNKIKRIGPRAAPSTAIVSGFSTRNFLFPKLNEGFVRDKFDSDDEVMAQINDWTKCMELK